jgi:hypothetical protein
MNVTLINPAALAGIAAPMRSKIEVRATPKYRLIMGLRDLADEITATYPVEYHRYGLGLEHGGHLHLRA